MIQKLLNTFLSSVLSDSQQQDLDQISPLHMNAHFTVNNGGLGGGELAKTNGNFIMGSEYAFNVRGK